MNMKECSFWGSLIVLICLGSFTVACNQQPGQPIKIGFSINLSGAGSAASQAIRNGALLAEDRINSQGGINGRPLELLIRDDENSDEGIKKADQGLIDEGVIAIFGHSGSTTTFKAYPLVTSQETLLITAFASTARLSAKDDLFLRTTVDIALLGKKTAELLEREKVSALSIMIDMDNFIFTEDWARQVAKEFPGTINEVRFNSSELIEWEIITNKLLAIQPGAILFLADPGKVGIAAQKLKAKGYAGLQITSLWAQSSRLMELGGGSVEGISIITYVNMSNQRPEYIAFSRSMLENFNERADGRSSRAYELIMILADALKRCERLDANSLKKALLAGEYDTIMGKVKFDRFGDVVRPVYEVRVRGGRFYNNGEI